MSGELKITGGELELSPNERHMRAIEILQRETQTLDLRQTGIPLIGQVGWGTHICMFYESEFDLLQTTAAFFEAGLAKNEYCIWAVSDPITEQAAKESLKVAVEDFERYNAAESIEISSAEPWVIKEDEFNLQRITGGWASKLSQALDRGYDGLRLGGNATWLETNHWKEFCEYELELDRNVAGKKIVVLCTHASSAIKSAEVREIVRAHHFTIALRNRVWEFVDSPDLKDADELVKALKSLSKRSLDTEQLTRREKIILSQIMLARTNKQIATLLAVSPRTIEFHRANIMAKTGAKNAADLVRIMLDGGPG